MAKLINFFNEKQNISNVENDQKNLPDTTNFYVGGISPGFFSDFQGFEIRNFWLNSLPIYRKIKYFETLKMARKTGQILLFFTFVVSVRVFLAIINFLR